MTWLTKDDAEDAKTTDEKGIPLVNGAETAGNGRGAKSPLIEFPEVESDSSCLGILTALVLSWAFWMGVIVIISKLLN